MKIFISSAHLAVLGFSLLLSLNSLAQINSLKDIVVSASRFEEPRLNAPTAIQVITREDIQNAGITSLPDVLMMLGGVNVRSLSSGQLGINSTVDLGGFGPTATQNTLILLDGRPLNPIDSSEIVWSGIPLSSIQRVEIAPGAAGVQYGAGASGGLIHIFTNEKTSDRTQAGVRLGSFGTALLDFNLDRQINDLSVSLTAGAAKSDGWRENSQAKSQNLALRVKQSLVNQGYVFAEVLLAQQSNGFPGGVLGKVGEGNQQLVKFNNVGSENNLNQSGLRLGGFSALSARTTLDMDLTFGKKTSTFNQPYNDTADSLAGFFVSGAGVTKLTGETVSFSPKFRTEYANGTSLVYGYDFSKSSQNGANTFGPLVQQYILSNQGLGTYDFKNNILSDQQSVQLMNQSLFVMTRMPLSQRWELTGGIRRQIQSYDTSDLNKTVGFAQVVSGAFGSNAHEVALNHKLSSTSRTYLRFNQSYRFANTDEYWGFDTKGNRAFSGELLPQISKAYELGYDLKKTRHQFNAMLGQSVTQDEIRYNPTLFRNSNLSDNVFRTSASLNWSVQALAKSRLNMGVRFQRAEYLTGVYAGQALGLVPTSVFNLGWIQALDNRTRAGVQVLHVSKQNYDAAPGTVPTLSQIPAYTTADVFWVRTYGKLDTKLSIKNLTGSTYAAYGGYGFVSLPGGSGASSYYYYPSDPRAVYLSMTYRF